MDSLITAAARALAAGDLEPARFKMALGLKNIRLTLAVAEMLQVPMPIASLVRDHFLSSQARGESSSDWGDSLG